MMKLGPFLRSIREAKRLTLRAVEAETGISNAYLSQIESDKIRKPSPLILYKLAQFYNISYDELMQKAGHPVANTTNNDTKQTGAEKSNRLKKRSLTSLLEDMTTQEEEELIEYLAFLRSRKRSG